MIGSKSIEVSDQDRSVIEVIDGGRVHHHISLDDVRIFATSDLEIVDTIQRTQFGG